MRSLSKRDPRNVSFSVAPMLVDVPVAALHAVLKTRVGETKMQGKDILTACTRCGRVSEVLCSFVFKTDPRELNYKLSRIDRHCPCGGISRNFENARR